MAKRNEFFQEEFDRLAVNGVIGDPNGKPAYAYLRVSSDEQGEEGRSGLPRQIGHVHEKACQAGYSISWDRVYADDFTGFAIERPELSKLRREYQHRERRASAVVMEHLDRLSRNADWHQGFLLDEMKQAKVEAVFWKSFSSRIERAVMGAVAQEGMEQARERMTEGVHRKARSGRVTAHQPAYGYRLVDDQGNEGERAKKFSYYALHQERAPIVRQIYERVCAGDPLGTIAADFIGTHVAPPGKMRMWDATVIRVILKNPVYKGEFIAHRWIEVEVQKPTKDGLSTRTVVHREARPESEWIRVPVPPIVDPAIWQAANDMLAKNKQMARRNAKVPYLLTGLVKCATCGYSYTGTTRKVVKPSSKVYFTRCYRCSNGSVRIRLLRAAVECHQRQIAVRALDAAVWSVVCQAMLDPALIIKTLETDLFGEQNAAIDRQIDYREREIEDKREEDGKLYRAYVAGVFDENEYAERRRLLKADIVRLDVELANLYPQRADRAHFEAQKAMLLRLSEEYRSVNTHADAPFEVKQKIIKMMVNQIVLDARQRQFRLEGTLRGVYAIENIHVDTGSSP